MLQRTICYAFIMESSIIVFSWELLFMLFMSVRSFMLSIRESLFVVFTKERLFTLFKFTLQCIKVKLIFYHFYTYIFDFVFFPFKW